MRSAHNRLINPLTANTLFPVGHFESWGGGISTTAIDKNMDTLKAKGWLKRIGPDKGGHWEVRENGEWKMENGKWRMENE